jgi:putative transposase
MPWSEVCKMDLREQFVQLVLIDEESMRELCESFGISRKTGYKWLDRYQELGRSGLADQSRASQVHPNAVGEEVERRIIVLRGEHPSWGARKLKSRLERLEPKQIWPAASTIGSILKRHGLVTPRRRHRRCEPYTQPFAGCHQPNAVWCADFKGWFRTGDGQRCDPFTLSDAYSRYLLRCQAVTRPDEDSVWPVLVAAFREYGMPAAIRTDNGPPFASLAVAGLSRLSVKLLRLEIIPERIAPGRPDQNGRHERMHRTLKQETACPPKANLREQQRAFDVFCREFNDVRPHEAHQQQTPAQHYQASPKSYPLRLPEWQYPDSYAKRQVHHRGFVRFGGREIYLSQTLAGEWVGLDQLDERHHAIFLGALKLATLDCFLGVLTKDGNKKVRGSR